MDTTEITVPETKPASEWVLGRAVQKVSPKRPHAYTQKAFLYALDRWAGTQGDVFPEWRHRIAPPGEERRPLVPDVAYNARDRSALLTGIDREEPPFAPDIAVEVLSPGDSRAILEHKIDVYLRGGSRLVIVADPATRTVLAVDHHGPRLFSQGDELTHPEFPGLRIPLREVFEPT